MGNFVDNLNNFRDHMSSLLPRHKNIRLKEYDYSQAGLYFITVCVQDRLCLFGNVQNGEMVLNDAGQMLERWYNEIVCFKNLFERK